ncbi:MAG TPA: S8 family serine peptidase [Solirubrobacterales bacterium]|nr:S8 family serine peptidase [Solirubrobacterales bacterium]
MNVVGRANCVPVGENPLTEECISGQGVDGDGHGTHVAGIVGALDNNKGVVGIAPGVRLWAVRALNNNGSGAESWIVAAVDWVTATRGDEDSENDVDVANMSLSCGCPLPALDEAIEASTEAGVVYVVAAGNSASDAKAFSPASNPDVITVSALADYDGKVGEEAEPKCNGSDYSESGYDDTLATFSNYGKDVDIAAPGVCIHSTYKGGGYAYMSGTSMASPYVAGAAALLAAKDEPEDLKDVEAIRERLIEEGNLEWEDDSGDGQQEPMLDIGRIATEPPTIESKAKATLRGRVNPGGLATSYRFEYGTTTAYGTSAPVPNQSIGSGDAYVAVSKPIEGLKGQTTYHYRVVGSNSKGSFYGADRTFGTTPPAVAAETTASDIHGNDATLNAIVNPEGIATRYYFEYGPTASYGRKSPPLPKAIGSGTKAVEVDAPAGVLADERTYHYRVVAKSNAGTVHGEDHTFTTTAAQWSGERVEQANPNPLPDPLYGENFRSELGGVSCWAQEGCMAVGNYQKYAQQAESMRWDGESWTAAPMADPLEATESIVSDVSCVTADWCVAVGLYSAKPVEEQEGRPMIQQWDGDEWTAADSISLPKDVHTEAINGVPLVGVSCASLDMCMAVGYYPDPTKSASEERSLPLIYKWDGEDWVFMEQSLPAGLAAYAVDCPSPTWCMVAGENEEPGNGGFSPFAEIWDGDEWSVVQDATPEGGESNHRLSDVSCPEPDHCMALLYNPFDTFPHMESWDGTGWTQESLPTGPGAGAALALSLACPAADVCSAVGAALFGDKYAPMADEYAPVAYAWDGTDWSVQSAALPTHEAESSVPNAFLGSVSCPSASSCAAVGGDSPEEVEPSGIAEFYRGPGPVLITDSASQVKALRATLNGTVNPGGLSTTYRFEYGETKAYGGKVPTSAKAIGSGGGDVAVTETVKGLKSNTTYHYRVTATNAEGTTYGEDRTFSTEQFLPPHLASSFGEHGAGAGQLNEPFGIALDGSDNVWVADSENNRIEKFSPDGDLLLQVGSKGTGSAQFTEPYAIAVAPGGDVWVADTFNNRVQVFDSQGKFLKTLGWGVSDGTSKKFQTCKSSCHAGLPGEGAGQFDRPYGLTFDTGGNLWVINSWSNQVAKFNAAGEFLSQCNSGGGAHVDIDVDSGGGLWLVDYEGYVRKFNSKCEQLLKFGSEGSDEGEFDFPTGLGLDPEDNIWVADSDNDRVQVFNPNGEYQTQFGEGGDGEGQFDFPRDVALDSEGDVWVADAYNSRIQRWSYGPAATTKPATEVKPTTATLNGAVNPKGAATSYYFEYGKTTSYGSKVPLSPKAIGAGASDVAVSQTLTGLSKGTTYHYRVVAENAVRAVKGKDTTLTTPGAEWLNEGDPLEGEAEMAFSGDMAFNSLGTGLDCSVSASLATTGGSTGEIATFKVADCEGFGFLFEGCELSEAKAKGLPWAVEVGKTTLSVKSVSVEYALTECGNEEVESVTLSASKITATLDEPEQISAVSLSGTSVIQAQMGGEKLGSAGAAVEGQLEVLESIRFSGDMSFDSMGTGLDCTVDASLATAGGSTGEITAFDVDSCEGFGFLFEACELSEAKANDLPWAVEVGKTTLSFKGVSTEYALEECGIEAVEGVDLSATKITATLDEPEQISDVSLSGTAVIQAHMEEEELGSVGAAVDGELEVTDRSKPGRYGVG